jgi:hypothetical protein
MPVDVRGARDVRSGRRIRLDESEKRTRTLSSRFVECLDRALHRGDRYPSYQREPACTDQPKSSSAVLEVLLACKFSSVVRRLHTCQVVSC